MRRFFLYYCCALEVFSYHGFFHAHFSHNHLPRVLSIYRGHWKDGRRHGYGIAKYREGEVYSGEWRRGRRNGYGTLHLANSEVFDGGWDANKKHGLGVYFWSDGEVDVSWYEHDVRKESLRWTNDRRRAYRLDLSSSKKEPIQLQEAAQLVNQWKRKGAVFDC